MTQKPMVNSRGRAPFARSTKTIYETLDDIKATLKKFGATGFSYQVTEEGAGMEFEYQALRYRFWQALPADNEKEAARKWRVFYDRVRSTLIAVSEGMAEMSEVFLANVVVPESGQTVYQYMDGRLQAFREQKSLPPGEGE